MENGLSLGIDFGSRGCRAAAFLRGRLVSLPTRTLSDFQSYWLAFASAAEGNEVSFKFPSIKQLLTQKGVVPTGFGKIRPFDAAVHIFHEMRDIAESYLDAPVVHTTISVPAFFSESRRSAIKSAVLKAGHPECSLLNDALAMAIEAASDAPGDALLLVCNIGYSAGEVAIIRKHGQTFKPMGYESLERMTGQMVDISIMVGLVNILRKAGYGSILQGFTPMQWLDFRNQVEEVKHRLDNVVETHISFWNNSKVASSYHVPVSVKVFNDHLLPILEESLTNVDNALSRVAVSTSEVPYVLAGGGTCKIPVIRQALVEHFPQSVIRYVSDDCIARGAAAFAANINRIREHEDTSTKPLTARHSGAAKSEKDFLKLESVKTVTLPARKEGGALMPRYGGAEATVTSPVTRSETNQSSEQQQTNRLAPPVSRKVHHHLPSQIQPNVESQHLKALRKNWRITKAYDLLAKGSIKEAVSEAHLAFNGNPDNIEILEDMTEVHIKGAKAYNTIENYNDAISLLNCALSHDQTNMEIRNLIVERHYLHAVQLDEQGDIQGARRAVLKCLQEDRAHEKALKLKKRLAEE